MTTKPPSARRLRRQRKAALETQIEQQRVEIMVDAARWRAASSGIDDGWRQLQRFKAPLYALGGMLLIRSAKHPRSLVRIAKRAAAGILLMRRARRLLRLTRR
nr:YqjK family protein [Halomonas socia]